MQKRDRYLRGIAMLLCLSMVLGFVPGGIISSASTVGNTTPENLVLNGDFEASATEATSWMLNSGAHKVSIATDISGNTTNVLKVAQEASAGNMVLLSNVFSVEAGKQYELSMSVLHDITVNTQNQFTITVFWFRGGVEITSPNYATEYSDYASVTVPAPTGNWEQATAHVTAPAGAAQALVRFTMNNNKAQCVYVDDVVFEEATTSAPTGVHYTEQFENITASGWTASNNFSSDNVKTYANYYESTKSLFFQAANVWARSRAFVVTPGKEYTATFVTQRHNGTIPAGYVKIVFLNAAGEGVGEVEVDIGTGAPFTNNRQGNWVDESAAAIAPANAATAYLEFGRGASGGTFGIDNLNVTESEASDLDPDGTEASEPSDSTEPSDATEPGEFVLEENFESVTNSGWTASNNFSGDAVHTYPSYYENTNSLFFQAKNVWAKSGAFAVTPGMAYKTDFVTQRHSGSSPAGYAKIIFLDAAGETVGEKKAAVGTGTLFIGNKQENWKAETFTELAPEGAVTAYLEFGREAGGGNYGIDNLKVSEIDGSEYDPDETDPTEGTEPTEATTPSEPSTDELGQIINGSFEDGWNNWGGGAGEGASVSTTTDAYSGTSALLLTADKEQGRATNSLTQTVQLGNAKGVKLSAMVKRLAGEDVGYLGLWFYDGNNNLVPADTAYSINIAAKNEWTEYALEQAVPEGAVSVTIKFGNHSGKVMSYIVDDIKLTEVEVEVDTNVYVYKEHFEDVVGAGWTASNNFVGLDVGTYSSYYQATKSIFFQAKNVWAKSPAFDITAGKAYVASMVTQRHDGGIPAGYAKLIFLNAAGEKVGEKEVGIGTGVKFSGDKQGNWKTEYIAEIAPAGAVKAYFEFGRGAESGTYGIDNLKVREIEASEFNPNDFVTPETDPYGDLSSTVINGDFEDGQNGWKGGVGVGATAEIVTDGAYSGSSMLLTANKELGKATNTFTQTLKVGNVKAYKMSIMSKRLTGDNVGYIGLWFYDKNENLIPADTAFSINIARTTDWREDTLIQAVPEGATTVVIKFGNHSGNTMSYLVDNIKLEEYTGPADLIQPAVPGTSSGGGVIYEPVDPSQLNASFEELDANGLPKNWRFPSDKCTIVTPADAPRGKNVLQFVTDGTGGTVRSAPIKAEPGKTYEVKIMAKDIKSSGARIGLYMFDAEGKRLDDYCIVITTDGSGKWKMYTAIGVAPSNVATIEAWIWYPTKMEAGVLLDGLLMRESDVKVKPTYVPDPYTPPTAEELLANISTEYPRVFFDGKEDAKQTKLRRFDTLKTKYGFTWNSQYNALLEAADGYLVETQVRVGMNTGESVMMDIYPVLKDPSDLSYRQIFIENSLDDTGKLYDNPYTGFGNLFLEPLADRMRVFSLAYIMTGKTMYAERAISYAMQVTDWKIWGDEYWMNGKNLKAEASTGWMMAGMVAVYDMCYDQLTEAQRAKLERNIIDQGLKPLAEAAKPNSTVNGHMMMLGGMLSGCAAIMNEDNIDEIKPYLDIALTWAHNALSNFAYSGNTEGHYYTDFGLETFVPGLGHLYRVTRLEELIDHPFLSEMLPYWTVMWAEGAHGTHPNYSDGGIGAYMKLPMAVLSKLTNNPIIDGFLITAGGTGDMFENLVYLNPDPQPEYLTDYVGIVDVIGYGVLRTGFASTDMMLTMKANDSQMNHNHFDQNSIQLNIGGSWLIKDPGAGSYYNGDRTFWTSSGHSTIMVDGNSQLLRGTASMEMVFNNNLYGYIVGSAPRTYGGDYDGDILTKFDRHAIQINHEDKSYYMIIDDLASDKERTYTWHMYNGVRGTFAVDGQEVQELGSAQGNSISLALGKDVLNLKFVDNDKLTVEDYAHKSNGSPVGYGIAASTAATKTHQFMTLISNDTNPNVNFIDFVNILNNRRFTVPEYFEEGDINWDSSMPLGQESVKEVNSGGTPAVFFRGNKAGDWISFPITIEETGTYNASLLMCITDGACQVRAYFDDVASEIKDCSGLPVDTDELPFGELELTAGVHTVKIEVVGPGLDEDYEPGWFLIDTVGLNLERIGVETPPAKDLYVTETFDTPEALGALVNYIDNKYDMLMWNRTEGAATAGLLNTDAQQASVLGLIDGKVTEGFAATDATTLTYDGKVMFVSEKDVDIVASNTGWQVISAEAQTVKLTAVESEYDYVVTVNGETVDTKIENGILTVALAAGETTVAVVVDEPEPSKPTEPVTEPTEPVIAEDGADATLWIIAAASVVLLAGAATGIVLFVKKRKAK